MLRVAGLPPGVLHLRFAQPTGSVTGLRGVQSTVAAWYLGLDSELLFEGDAGGTEAGRPSRRVGVEWSTYARVRPWLVVDADVSLSRARYTDGDEDGPYVPGAPGRLVSTGLTIEPRQPFSGSLRLRHVGARPLTEDAEVVSTSSTLWNREIGWRVSPRAARLSVQVVI